jgi:hypothetical protein
MICPNCARIMYWTAHPHFREFLGEEAEEPQPTPDKSEGRRSRKPKAKASSLPEREFEDDGPATPPVRQAAEDKDDFGEEGDLPESGKAAAQG